MVMIKTPESTDTLTPISLPASVNQLIDDAVVVQEDEQAVLNTLFNHDGKQIESACVNTSFALEQLSEQYAFNATLSNQTLDFASMFGANFFKPNQQASYVVEVQEDGSRVKLDSRLLGIISTILAFDLLANKPTNESHWREFYAKQSNQLLDWLIKVINEAIASTDTEESKNGYMALALLNQMLERFPCSSHHSLV